MPVSKPAILLFVISQVAVALQLRVSTLLVKLPVALYSTVCAYDGTDSIYILGGRGLWTYNHAVFRFIISTETLITLGNLTDSPRFAGSSSAYDPSHGAMYIFAGEPTRNKIWKYSPGTLRLTEEANFTTSVFGSAAIWDDTLQSAFVFGGGVQSDNYNGIRQYIPANRTLIQHGRLATPPTISSPAAVWDDRDKNAYIFGGGTPASVADIKKYHPSTNTSNNVALFLPEAVYAASAVWDSGTRRAFIFGGDKYWGDDKLSGLITVFNPESETAEVLESRLPAPLINSCALYVDGPGPRRAYLFGGWTTGGETDAIVRVDIDELRPSTTTTTTPDPDPSPTTEEDEPGAPYKITLSKTKLPYEIKGLASAYDGRDSIYLLGGSRHICDIIGCYQSASDQIWKFTVSTEELRLVGRFNELPPGAGLALWNAKREEVLFFGGRHLEFGTARSTSVWSFAPAHRNVTYFTEVPTLISTTSLAFDGEDRAFLFGDNAVPADNTMVEYAISTGSSEAGPTTPNGVRLSRGSAVWNPGDECAYILGGWSSNTTIRYCPANRTYTRLPETLPTAAHYTTAVWDGSRGHAYVIGGVVGNGREIPTVVRYAPSGGVAETLPVELPYGLQHSTAVWVPNSNRIYLFGGYKAEPTRNGDSDDIIRIDVNLNLHNGNSL